MTRPTPPVPTRVAASAGLLLALLLLASPGGSSGDGSPSHHPSPTVALLSASARLDRALAEATPLPSPTPTPAPAPAPPPPELASPPPEPPPPAPEPQPRSPAPSRPAPPQPTPTPPLSYPDPATADALISLTNQLRAAHGLTPLGANPALTASAAAYAQVLALNDWFSHTGPDGSSVASRLQSAGYYPWSFAAENVYRGPTPIGGDAILDAWAGSAPHLDTLLNTRATEIGIGCYVYGDDRWCVQDFGAR